jgi:hypothetical protein
MMMASRRRVGGVAASQPRQRQETTEGAGGQMAQDGLVLTKTQLVALEKARSEKLHGEFETECPSYCGAQDTFYVGNMKGVGRIYQQTFIDTYTKAVFAKLYGGKTPIIAAEILNDRVLPFLEHGIMPGADGSWHRVLR